MSGHSKWSTIKHQKGAADAARGKIFTRHAKLIQIATREGGGDPSSNAKLAAAVDAAKADSVPKDNIERAIKKGTGTDGGADMAAKTYEGYGPGGVAILINVLTDNVNRTVSNVRHLLDKNGGKMAESGSVAFQFEKRGVIVVDITGKDAEEVELTAIDAGAIDVEVAEDELIVKTAMSDLMSAKQKLIEAGLTVESAELADEPTQTVELTDVEAARKAIKLIELLEADDDVDTVAANFDIPEEVLAELG